MEWRTRRVAQPESHRRRKRPSPVCPSSRRSRFIHCALTVWSSLTVRRASVALLRHGEWPDREVFKLGDLAVGGVCLIESGPGPDVRSTTELCRIELCYKNSILPSRDHAGSTTSRWSKPASTVPETTPAPIIAWPSVRAVSWTLAI